MVVGGQDRKSFSASDKYGTQKSRLSVILLGKVKGLLIDKVNMP